MFKADRELLQIGCTLLDAGVSQYDIINELKRFVLEPFSQRATVFPLEVDGYFHQFINEEYRVPIDFCFLCKHYGLN